MGYLFLIIIFCFATDNELQPYNYHSSGKEATSHLSEMWQNQQQLIHNQPMKKNLFIFIFLFILIYF